MLRFLTALAGAMLITVPVQSEPPSEGDDGEGHWLQPLHPLVPFGSSNSPFSDSKFTPEEFRKLLKNESGELFWFILFDGLPETFYRFALAVDYDPNAIAGSDPFADSERPENYVLRVSWDFSDGDFQSHHLLEIDDDFSTSLKLLGEQMTEEVGYPVNYVPQRLSPRICFGYGRGWFYGEGFVPERGPLKDAFRAFQRLCWRLSHPNEVDPFADPGPDDILDPVKSLTRKAVTAGELPP